MANLKKIDKHTGPHKDDLLTPEWFIEALLRFEELNLFGLDPCTETEHIPAALYCGEKENGLKMFWAESIFCVFGEVSIPVFVNPPYGRQLKKWANKCVAEYQKGCRIYLLVPASMGCKWFQEIVMPHAGFYVFPPRIAFVNPETGLPLESPNFDPVLIYFGDDAEEKARRWAANPPLKGTLMRTVGAIQGV